ncbi:MAG: bifunctional hydroxymethylpyrimidine kinase/phosphomethylpyrimidine kinase [Thermoanaerobaculia bacterium]|nr:bifunctional hydroxymethylpyrimidine kinase/phosphomethylpyrimidine kinase [Thermoanaerobaculia bacterium]
MTEAPPRLLTVAGSDSGGGAGIQADLKTFDAHGVYGMTAITAVTAQNTREVAAVEILAPGMVRLQIDAVFEDIGVDAVKIGMLGSAGVVRVVADRLREWEASPVVLDPVMVAKSGDTLLEEDAIQALKEELVPTCSLVTPNTPELERLAALPTTTEAERVEAAIALAASGPAVLAKGGHDAGETVVDLLVLPTGEVRRYEHRRVDTRSTHGTGCTLSSAIAARLASGASLEEAVAGGIGYLQRALTDAFPLGEGHGPVNHFVSATGEDRG